MEYSGLSDRKLTEEQKGGTMEYIAAKPRPSVHSTEENKAVTMDQSIFTADSGEYAKTYLVENPAPAFSGKVFPEGTLEGCAVFQV